MNHDKLISSDCRQMVMSPEKLGKDKGANFGAGALFGIEEYYGLPRFRDWKKKNFARFSRLVTQQQHTHTQ